MNTKKIKILILAAIAAIPTMLTAQDGSTVFNFLRLPYSAHAAALGGNNISLPDDDITLAMHNPALLVNVSDKTLSLGYMTYMSDSKVAGAAFNRMIGKNSVAAVAARYVDYGSFDGYTPDNEHTGSFTAKDIEISLMYSRLLGERWSGGISGKFIHSKYESYTSMALGVDLGVNYYNEDSEFSASLAVRNLGGQVKAFEERHESMPLDVQIGLTKRLSHAPIRFSVTLVNLHKWSKKDFPNADGSEDSFGTLFLKHAIFGVDLLIGSNFYASLGYNYRMAEELSAEGTKWDGLTAGAGITLKRVKLGLSYSKLHVSSSSLQINASYTL